LLAACVCAIGQNLSTVTGTIVDSSGAVVPGVLVRVVNSATGETLSGTANEAGAYVIPLVKPGEYRMTVEQKGFKRYERRGMVLETGQTVRADLVLEVGAVTEVVQVTDVLPQLQSETAAVGAVIANNTIANMPLLGRRAAQLARLQGFVVSIDGGSSMSIAGGRGNNTAWVIDGGNAQNVTLGIPSLSFDPPVESLQEFNVAISNFAAELGRTGGGVVQMTTRSGTNSLHGSAYEYLRNDALDARSFFSATKPVLRYNLFGASVRGPIKKDRAFFFFNYEGRQQSSESTYIQNVPTRAETQGDFSGNTTAVRDPAAAGRPPFPGNAIPASRLDPVGKQLAAFYPEPNVPGRPTRSSNFRTNGATRNPSNTYVARVDYNLGAKDRLYGRFLGNWGDTIVDPIYPVPGTDSVHTSDDNSYYNVSGTWFRNLTAATINEFRISMDYRDLVRLAGGSGTGLNGKLGIKGVEPTYFAQVSVTGLAALGRSPHSRLQKPIRNNMFVNHTTMVRGGHTIKFGGEYRYAMNEDLQWGLAGGGFTFNNVATGDALAALLLGWTQRGQLQKTLLLKSRANTHALFIQDDWKVTPTFTLNLGLRWDADQPRWEQNDSRQSSFDRNAINPVCNCPGTITFSGRNGLSKYAHNWDLNNFGPRVGFAWRVANNLVIRAGGAVIYNPLYTSATPMVANLGFSYQLDLVSPDNGLTPALILANGMPPLAEPKESDLTPGFGAVPIGASPITSPDFFEPSNRRTGYLETFNLNIQRQFPGQLMLELGYLGSMGHKLAGLSPITINQVPVNKMGPGNAQVLRPFPQFSDVTVLAPANGNSNYHAMNIKVEKRMSAGLQFQTNYTWAKSIDDIEALAEVGGSSGSGYANTYDRRADRSVSGNDIRHRIIGSVVYDLPFGSGRRWSGSGALNAIAGEWSLGYIAEMRTGAPYGVVEQTNRTNSFSPSVRPDLVGNPVIPGDRSKSEELEMWFNTAAFADPGLYRFGNAGRINGYGPGLISMDLSVLKDFRFGERHRLQLRCEMMNFLNHANFGLPNLSRGNAAFGRITGLGGGVAARIIQFGLHYKF
jgi:hypothetical protein